MNGNNWRHELYASIRKAKIRVVGQDDIKNEAQAKVAIAIINEYGNSPSGFIYIEPYTAKSTKRPPDVLLCHPDIGVLVIEVKGYDLDSIQEIEAGKVLVRQRGYNRPIDPFAQAAEAMYKIKNEVERIVRKQRLIPLFSYMASFPNISESDWSSKGYDKALPEGEILFREHLENTRRLRQRISMLIRNSLIDTGKKTPLNVEQIQVVEQVLGKSSTINENRPPRDWVDERKLGAYVDEMAALDKYLSAEQRELSRLKVDGYPRLIRGVAGSGKTVVLAEMVARFIHRKISQPNMFNEKPDVPRIAVVCFNRALVQFIQRKIRDSYNQQTLEKLPHETVNVTHLNGLMSTFSDQGIWQYVSVKNVPDASKRALFYHEQLKNFAKKNPEWYNAILFDAIFVDEGQDFVADEYKLLLELIKPHPQTGEKTLVIFYDDAQNLYALPRPNWKDIGIDVSRGDRARVMKESFRNTREVVELAFNVLLGSQAPPHMRVQTRTYADVNYLKQRGLIEEHGDHFRVRFAERTYQKPSIHKFASREQEKQWIAIEVSRLIKEELVRPEDILVLFHRSQEFNDLPDIIKKEIGNNLIKGFIKPYGEHHDDKDKYIFRDGYLTLSTTYGAKGYDAQIVFLVGVDLFESDNGGRASFYVGATRAKMLLYISGLDRPDTLLVEAELVNNVL